MPNGGADGLRRHLGVFDAAAIYVGIILGSGIFFAPAAVAAATPSAPLAIGVWILGGVVAACGAMCYAESAARLPKTGGFFIFYREAYGELLAFIAGWAALLVTYPASIAVIALICADYLLRVFPSGLGERSLAVAVLLACAMLNVIGARTGPRTQRLLTVSKFGALLILCGAALVASRVRAGTGVEIGGKTGTGGIAVSGLLAAVVAVLWTYEGWSDVSLVAGEIRNPGRNLGRAVLLGTGALVVLYTVAQASVLMLLSPQQAASPTGGVLARAVEAGLGEGSGKLVALLVVTSTFGSIHGIVFAVSRLGFAMAREGAFPGWFGVVNPRWGTPARAVAVVTGASIIYVFSGTFRTLLGFFSFSVWIFYGLTAVALLILRKRGIGEPLASRFPGGYAAPAVVLLTSAGMTSSLMRENTGNSLVGLCLLLAGVPAYLIWKQAIGKD